VATQTCAHTHAHTLMIMFDISCSGLNVPPFYAFRSETLNND